MIELGQILDGKYRIVRLIGEGGMGAVFEGENTFIHRRVAIKVLHPQASADAGAVMRFEREAQAAGRIGSDHILEVLDLGHMSDGSRYMVMEFLDGEPFSARIRRMGRMTGAQMAPIVRQILVGLGAAHGAGIVHRDLKPDNIFILREKAGTRDFVKIIDFGISKFNVLGGDMSMTRTGAVMGTPYYMSPEQAKGSGGVDHRTDIYAVGVMMYEAATGSVPFTGNTFNELMFKIALSTPQPIREIVPDVDPRFADFIDKAMARELSARFGSTAEMLQALDSLGFAPSASGAPGPVTHQQVPMQAGAFTPATGVVTQDTFAASQVTPSRSSLGPAIAATVGLIVLAGGAFAAYRALSSGGEPAAAASSAGPVPSVPTSEAAPEKAEAMEVPAPPSAPPPSASAGAVASAPKPSVQPRPAAAAPKPQEKPAAPAKAAPPPKSRDFGY